MILFEEFKSQRTFEGISNKIKDLIVQGHLKPGDKLPSENELAQRFHVGRQTIREALRYLELSGFIQVKRGGQGGPVIANTILDRLKDGLLDALQMKDVSLTNITQVRSELENLILRHAHHHHDHQDIDELRKNISRAQEKIDNGQQAFEENVQFHIILARASKNPVYALLMKVVMAIVSDSLRILTPDLTISKRVVDSHRVLLQALLNKDLDQAESILKEHLSEVDFRLEETLRFKTAHFSQPQQKEVKS